MYIYTHILYVLYALHMYIHTKNDQWVYAVNGITYMLQWALCSPCLIRSARGSLLIRRRRGHPGVVLALVVSNSANR